MSVYSYFLVVIGIFTVLLVVAYILWRLHINKWSHLPIVKGCLPFIGHIHMVKAASLDGFVEWIYDVTIENGPTYVMFFFWKPVLFTSDVNFGKTFLSSQKFITRSKQIKVFSDLLGTGVLTSNGNLWRERRHLITPAFHLDILSRNIPIIESQAKSLIQHIKASSEGKNVLKFVPMCRLFSLGTICEFAMGVPIRLCSDNPEPSAKRFSDISDELNIVINERFFNPLYDFYFRFTEKGKRYFSNINIFNSFVNSIIEERIKIHQQSNTDQPKVFVDILLDAYQKNQIDIQGMINEVNTFILAGNETIAFSLAWVVYHLGKRPNIQDRLYEEFLQYKDKSLSMKEIIKEAIFLDCVIKEILRVSSFNAFARYVEEDTNINNIFVPRGTEVTLLGHSIHADDGNWKNPDEFRPERFQEEGPEQYNFKYLPFSAGPRNCIGKRLALAELKVAVYHIILNFKIEISKEIENSHRFPVLVHKDTEFIFKEINK